jgi:large subunit ribosomal protein L21
MSYAVFKTGGKQYRVSKGDTLSVEKLDGEAGATVTFNEVLLVGEGAGIKAGGEVKSASVTGEIVEQYKGPKLLAYRYKRRKGYHRTVGHRQRLTKVKVTGINA